MIQIVKNRYIDALLKLILVSAIVHMVLLIIYSVITGDFVILNYFNILDIDLIFPNVIEGTVSQVLSVLATVIVYVLILLFYTKK